MITPTTSPPSDWDPSGGKTSDELLAMGLAALHGFDPDDEKTFQSPEWQLLCAFQALHELLSAGGPLPEPWRTEHRR